MRCLEAHAREREVNAWLRRIHFEGRIVSSCLAAALRTIIAAAGTDRWQPAAATTSGSNRESRRKTSGRTRRLPEAEV